MAPATYGLCEAVSDLTSLFMAQEKLPADSRVACSLVIDWAGEFDRKHAQTDWAMVGYLDTIGAFFFVKYRAWLESAPARSVRNNS